MSGRADVIIQILLWPLPWPLRRVLLQWLFKYEIHPTARIGYSVVMPRRLHMARGSVIRHLNVIRGMDLLSMAAGAGISRANWVYATPSDASIYAHEPDRRPQLILEEGAGITNRHLIDCSATVRIGRYSMLVGAGTQVLTHAVTIRDNRAITAPVMVGEFCMVATRSVIMMGASLPSCSALGPGSVLRDRPTATHTVYSGVPAIAAARLPTDAAFFRAETHVSYQRAHQPGRNARAAGALHARLGGSRRAAQAGAGGALRRNASHHPYGCTRQPHSNDIDHQRTQGLQ